MYLRPAATMVVTIDVDVEELCRKAVVTTPIIRPHRGLENNWLLLNMSPAARPADKKTKKMWTVCFIIERLPEISFTSVIGDLKVYFNFFERPEHFLFTIAI